MCAISIPAAVVQVARTVTASAARSIPSSRRVSVAQAPRRPSIGHPADHVVVGRRAPQGQGRRRRERGVEEAPPVVERDVAGPALMWCGGRRPRLDLVVERDLRPADLVPGGGPLGGGRGEEAEGQPALAGAGIGEREAGDGDLGGRARGDRRERQVAGRRDHAARSDLPGRAQPAGVAELPAVLERDPALAGRRDRRRTRRGPHRRREVHVLEHRGLGRAVGERDPVDAEHAVVGLVAEVAAVGVAHRPVRQPLLEAVVAPLPDEPALEPARGLDGVPVLGERPVAVAHRVAELAHDQRVPLPIAPGVGEDGADRRVHRAQQVARCLAARPVELDRALVVERPRRVRDPRPAGRGVVIHAVARTRCPGTRRRSRRGADRARSSAPPAPRTGGGSAGPGRRPRTSRATRCRPRRSRTARARRTRRAARGRWGSATSGGR